MRAVVATGDSRLIEFTDRLLGPLPGRRAMVTGAAGGVGRARPAWQ
jgi:hypothetical protein